MEKRKRHFKVHHRILGKEEIYKSRICKILERQQESSRKTNSRYMKNSNAHTGENDNPIYTPKYIILLYPEREQKIKWRRVECTQMVLYFYLRRGELPGCLLRLQRGVPLKAYRLALLYALKQASYKSGSCGYLCIALGSGGTICLSPVDKNHLSVSC